MPPMNELRLSDRSPWGATPDAALSQRCRPGDLSGPLGLAGGQTERVEVVRGTDILMIGFHGVNQRRCLGWILEYR